MKEKETVDDEPSARRVRASVTADAATPPDPTRRAGSGRIWPRPRTSRAAALLRSTLLFYFSLPLLVRQPLCPRRRPGTAPSTAARRWRSRCGPAVSEILTYWTPEPVLSPGNLPVRARSKGCLGVGVATADASEPRRRPHHTLPPIPLSRCEWQRQPTPGGV